jgi:cytochrome c oxidase assembly factor 1
MLIRGQFETLEWSLEPEGGPAVSLLDSDKKGLFTQETADQIAVAA